MCKEIFGYIYMVRNKVNGKIYFGKTENNFKTRYSGNITKYTHNEHLQNSIKKYGIENFEINEQFDFAYNEDDLLDLEDMYMCIYNTLDKRYGYNKRRSGSKHKGYGKHSEESKRKQSETMKGKYVGEKSPNYGKPKSEETKRKISETKKGKKYTLSPEQRHKLKERTKGEKNPFYGKHHSEETKAKLREINTGKKASDETKRKMSETRKGKPLGKQSESHVKKLTEIRRSGIFEGDKNPNAKKVICLNTGEVFDTIKFAREWVGSKVNIGSCCLGKTKTAGKHPQTGERLKWMYYDEYLETIVDSKTEDVA